MICEPVLRFSLRKTKLDHGKQQDEKKKKESAQISNKVHFCIRNEGFGASCALGRVALNASGAGVVVFVHVVLMSAPSSAFQVTVLQVGIDVQVLVHALRLLGTHLSWEEALQFLQLVLGEEIGWWEHHLQEATTAEFRPAPPRYRTELWGF